MAAVDLPYNDFFLSALHESRNSRKALERQIRLAAASGDAVAMSAAAAAPGAPAASSTGNAASDTAAAAQPPSLLSAAVPSLAAASGAGAEGTGDLSVSDAALLSSVPTPLLRLLVLLAPLIATTAQFVRLATWTGGPGTGSHSFTLVLIWCLVCLYGYEVLRFAPHLVILAVMATTGLSGAVRGRPAHSAARRKTLSAPALNAILADVSELADFASTLSTQLIAPLVAVLSWRAANPANSRRLAIFLITTWPVWLLCFSPGLWDAARLPRIGLQAGERFRLSGMSLAQRLWVHIKAAQLEAKIARALNLQTSLAETPVGLFFTRLVGASTPVRSALARTLSLPLLAPRGGHMPHIALLPPWPLFALTLRHALLAAGTLALTWCAPWAALIRHALWRSATVRRSVLAVLRILSGEPRSAFGSGRVRQSVKHDADDDVPHAFRASAAEKGASDVTRHEDVEYQFTIYENQRWWVGLDWTAALLPQERPAWSDDSNNPVSPPSSFSLPPARVTLKPSPTRENPEAYTRRLVKWQWIDAEWSVAGRDAFSGSLSDDGDRASAAGMRQGYLGDAIGRLRAGRRTSVSSVSQTPTSAASGTFENAQNDVPGMPSSATEGSLSARRQSQASTTAELPADLAVLDVDVDGWQYGDNAWEKMSRKSGMGRYTRRRRWVRRAVLVELVERNYVPTEKERLEAASSVGGAVELSSATASSLARIDEGAATSSAVASSPAPPAAAAASPPASPSTDRGDLRQRLARAAASASASGEPGSPRSS